MYSYNFSIPIKSTGDVLSVAVESSEYISDYSDYRNIAFLKRIIHKNTIRPRFRITLLNIDETPRYQIPNEDILPGGSYSENYQNGQRRSLSFSLINEDGRYTPSVGTIWKGTKFLFEIGIEISNTDIIVWFKKGIMVVRSANPSRSTEQKTVSVDCVDKFGVLESKICTFDTTVSVENGTDIKSVFVDTLTEDIGNGNVIDTKEVIYHSSFDGRKLPLTITESSGSNYGALFLQLADVLSAEIFYNSEGNLTIIPIVDVITDGDKPAVDAMTDKNGDYQNNDLSFDFTAIVNRIVVIGSNVNGSVCMAEKVNDDPSSPLCYQKIGMATEVVNDSNITNKQLAEERAEYELRKRTILGTTQSSSVLFNPLLSVNQVVTYTDDFYNMVRERFVIQSVSYNIGYEGIMSLSTSNINNLPFVI